MINANDMKCSSCMRWWLGCFWWWGSNRITMYLFCTSTHIYNTTNGSHLSTQRVKALIHTIKPCVKISNTNLKVWQNIHHLTKGMSFRSLSWFIFFTLISSHLDEIASVVRILVAHLGNGCQVIHYCNLNQFILRLQNLRWPCIVCDESHVRNGK